MYQATCIPRPFPLKWRWKQSAGTIESISTTPAIPTVPPSALPTSRGCIRSSIEKSFARLLKKAPNFVLGSTKSSSYPRGYASGFVSPAASLAAFLSSLPRQQAQLPSIHALISAYDADQIQGFGLTHLAVSGKARSSVRLVV